MKSFAKPTFWGLRSFALCGLLLGLSGCGEPSESSDEKQEVRSRENTKQPRLVVLYVPCSVSKVYLGPYAEEERALTPNLSRFAEESVVFDAHMSEAGISGPSYASIFTGAQARLHRVFRHPTKLSPDLYLSTEAFLDAGYDAHYWSGHPMASNTLRYAQGVPEENVIATDKASRNPGDIREWDKITASGEDFASIVQEVAEDPDYRAYVQVSFTVTHSPYLSLIHI